MTDDLEIFCDRFWFSKFLGINGKVASTAMAFKNVQPSTANTQRAHAQLNNGASNKAFR